ncbi:MAG: 3'-5' exonuclease, partial [Melioribacter sp.]|nr:3'-5' exonuclease [Melioribacter sp.]
ISIVRIINDAAKKQNENCQIAIDVVAILSKYPKAKKIKEKITLIKLIDEKIITDSSRTVRKTGYLNKNRDDYSKEINTAEEIFSIMKNFYDIQNDNKLHFELARFGKNFIDIYNYVLNVYSEKKHQRSYLDFEDILLFTQNILKLDDVKLYLQKKYKYIMIDEYQDTNELQYKIFMPILDDLKTGNLFVVGDEKQSIYMFRDAELEIFNRTKEEIKRSEPEGKLLNLPHSFRMAPQIILFTNKLFSKLFTNPEPFYNEVEYSELICTKDETEEGTVEFILADAAKEITEAEMVANKIIEITSGASKKVEFRDIGILCRKRDYFEELEKEFIKKKIPYIIVGGKGFYQQQIIYDIYNYLSFLINQNDDAALIGILRSPFYTISDTELYEISLEEGKNFFEKFINKSSQNENYKTIVNQILKHIDMAISSELYALIRQILLDTNYWAVIASKRNSEQELANINKLISLARNYSKKSFKNLYDFVFALKNSIKTIEDESQAQIVKDEDAVKLLTIHQAKGLEYKAVFIYGCNGYTKEDSVRTRGMNIDKVFGFLVKVPLNNDYYDGYYTPPVAALYNYINYKKNIAEIKRLIYVAVTRAMNYLYISLTHKDFKPQRDSFFYFINEGLKLDFSADELILK